MEKIRSIKEFEEYVFKGYWGNQVLGDLFDFTVRDYPERIALVEGEKRVTYQQFGKTVNRLCFKLLERGIGKGDFIIILLPNCVEFAFFHYAAAKIGAIAIPMVSTQQIHEVRYAVNLVQARTLIISSGLTKTDFVQMAGQLRNEFPFLKNVIAVGETPSDSDIIPFQRLMVDPSGREEDQGDLQGVRPKGSDLLRIIFSAGTTGIPKAMMRTHNDTIANLKWDYVFHDWGENLLLFFPLGHSTGFVASLDLQVYLGNRITLMPGKFNPDEVFGLIEKEKVTSVYLPTPLLFSIAEALENRPRLAREYNLRSLKKMSFGGAQAPAYVIRTVKEAIGRPVLQTWGMGEGPATSSLVTDPPYVQTNTIGKIQCPDGEVKVIGENGREVPTGQPGELICKGPFLFAGYYNDPELTQRSFDEEGYFHTGDQVILDHLGNIKIVGRLKDIIRRGGEPISPAEIEELIERHEKVREVAVVAMPDKKMVEKVCAYIVPKADCVLTFDEIISFLRGKGIANFKLPERIELIDQLPRGDQKKNVLKKVLRDDITNKLKAEGKI